MLLTNIGFSVLDPQGAEKFTVAVRFGDLAPVPEPAAMLLTGLIVVGAMARRRRSR
jgi:hypothetical protein